MNKLTTLLFMLFNMTLVVVYGNATNEAIKLISLVAVGSLTGFSWGRIGSDQERIDYYKTKLELMGKK